MSKIKWKYSVKDKQWYVSETLPWANDGLVIAKDPEGKYALHFDDKTFTPRFRKLSSAKKVAELLRNG